MAAIRLLIADDHALFRDGLRAILKSALDIEIVGEAGTGRDALALVADLAPDVVLMDIQMPDINGIEATRLILETRSETGIIIVTMLEDDDSLFSAMRAGARGYVLKGADKEEMLKSIRAVAQGEALFGRAVAARLSRFFRDTSYLVKKHGAESLDELTEREHEILSLMAAGRTNADIAGDLHISLKTVRNHVSSIYGKLQVADRVQAVLRAREAGLH